MITTRRLSKDSDPAWAFKINLKNGQRRVHRHTPLEWHIEKYILYGEPTLYNFLVSSCFIEM